MSPQDASGSADPFPIDGGMVDVAQAMRQARVQVLDIMGFVIPPQLGVGGRSFAPPAPIMDASDAAVMEFPGTDPGGDKNVTPLRGRSTPPGASLAVRSAYDDADLHPREVDLTATEQTPGEGGQVPCVQDPGLV